jgi:hypothetical protein
MLPVNMLLDIADLCTAEVATFTVTARVPFAKMAGQHPVKWVFASGAHSRAAGLSPTFVIFLAVSLLALPFERWLSRCTFPGKA